MANSQGKVTASDYLAAAKYARAAKMTLSDDFWQNVFPELAIEMKTGNGGTGGAGGPGTGFMSMFAMGAMGKMTKVTAEHLQAAGLLAGGMLPTMTTGTHANIIDKELFAKDPAKWQEKYVIPFIKKTQPNTANDPVGMSQAIADFWGGSRTATSMFQELHNKQPTIERWREGIKKIGTHEQLTAVANHDIGVSESAMNKQLQNLQVSIFQHVLPVMIPMMNSLSDAIGKVAREFEAHPDMAKGALGLIGLTAAMGGILDIGGKIGTVAIVAQLAGFGTGLTGIGAAIAPFLGPAGLLATFALGLGGIAIYRSTLDSRSAPAKGIDMAAGTAADMLGITGMIDGFRKLSDAMPKFGGLNFGGKDLPSDRPARHLVDMASMFKKTLGNFTALDAVMSGIVTPAFKSFAQWIMDFVKNPIGMTAKMMAHGDPVVDAIKEHQQQKATQLAAAAAASAEPHHDNLIRSKSPHSM